MSIWREVMQTADSAKATMAFERVAGEQIFQRLLAQHPRDGMIYFKRGEAYEALGEYEHAVQDFQRAETLFPHPEWKQRAWDARIRVERQGRRRETVQDRGGTRLQRVWLENSFKAYIEWLLDKWGYAQHDVQEWLQHCAQMILWYSVAGRYGLTEQMADNFVGQVRRNRLDLLPYEQRRTWDAAVRLAQEICVQRTTHPVMWFTAGCQPLEAGWRRLDALPYIGPKIASFILRDLSFMRDYHGSPRVRALTQNNARDSRWFAQLAEEDQALFVPIDLHVHAEAVEHGVSPTAVRYDRSTIQSDPTGTLHRQVATEIVRWAQRFNFDPRDVNVYWYSLRAGNVYEDGTPVP
jgi:tetratricopeptide (TPR) repeat protein